MPEEGTESTPEPRRRGRPRSQETIQRDDAVRQALSSGPHTKEQLVEKLSLPPTLVYLSLWRLRRDGQAEKVAGDETRHLWQLTN